MPDLETLPAPVLAVIRDIYGTATSDLFLVAAPIAFLAVLAVVFIKEKPLSTSPATSAARGKRPRTESRARPPCTRLPSPATSDRSRACESADYHRV